MKIKEVIVVEGKSDTVKIKQAVDADTIETNGSAINDEILQIIKHAQSKRGVIIFTDPDYPGERIRHIIDKAVPGCKHAFLQKHEAKAKSSIKNIGIEHATVTSIQQALQNVHERAGQIETDITKADLIRYGLIGEPDARNRREALGVELKIGYTNGKQLLNRLHMFHIKKDELNQAMKHILS